MTNALNGYTFTKPASLLKRERLLEILKTGGTATQIGAQLGLQKNATLHYIAKAKADGVKIRIAGWVPNSPGSPSPIYKLGWQKDAAKPVRMSDAEKQNRRREKDGVREAEAMTRRAKRIQPRRDPLVAALFGPA